MHPYKDSSAFGRTSRSCLLCFDQHIVAIPNNGSKLFDNCCKYLHSAIIRGTEAGDDLSFEKQNTSFCEKCLKSAVELLGLTEQLEYCQRSISELIFMFSLRILHRRKRYSPTVNPNKIEQVDTSGLPDLDNDFELAAVVCPFQESTTECPQQLPLAQEIEENLHEIEDPVDYFDPIEPEITITEVKIETDINDEAYCDNSFKMEDITVSTSSCLQMSTVEASKNVIISKEPAGNSLPFVRLERLNLKNMFTGGQNKLSKGIKIGNIKSLNPQGLQTESIANGFPKIYMNPLMTPKVDPISLSVTEVSDFVREEVKNAERKRYNGDLQDEPYDPKCGNNHENRFKCKKCKKTFRFKCILVNHEKTHKGDRPFQCDVCSKTFKNKHTLANHGRIHTGEKPYECEVCHKQFTFQSSLITHKFTHTGEKRFQCNICKRRFTQKSALLTHYKVHSVDKKRKTRQLKNKVNTPNSDPEDLKCNICGKMLGNKQSLIRHQYCHTMPHKCQVCGKRFLLKEELDSHSTMHEGEKLQCPVCNKMFASKTTLTIHQNIHTGEKPYQCSICFKSFRQYSSLYSHRKIHNKPHKCQECNKRFTLKSGLEVHMAKHTSTSTTTSSTAPFTSTWDSERFKCQICGKVLTTKQSLQIHSSIHTGVKPFQCTVCFKSFRQPSNLQTHMKVHSKSHKCNFCRKRFAHETQLDRHMSRHKGAKQQQQLHKCDFCPYSTVYPTNLKSHMMRKHSENKCRCRDCGKIFATAEQLKGHYKRIHFAIDYTDDCAVPIS